VECVQSPDEASQPRPKDAVVSKDPVSGGTQGVPKNSRDLPETLLLVCVTAGMELFRSETFHPANEFLACPAEPLIGRVAKPENGKARLVKEVAWEVRTEEQLPQFDHWSRFGARARRRENEDDEGLADQVFLGRLGGLKTLIRDP